VSTEHEAPATVEDEVEAPALAAGTVLVRADGLGVELSDGHVVVDHGGRKVAGNQHTLAVLDAFATPRTLQDGLDHLSSRTTTGLQTWASLVNHVRHLCDHGVLTGPQTGRLQLGGSTHQFHSPPVHIRMLDDEVRTRAFQEAIRRTVTPDDVVLDIGTGTGVLAVTAALAGARHVYAIEGSPIIEAARAVVEHNGLQDRITIIEGYSVDVEVPERATVLVTETIGDDPLGEHLLNIAFDAKQRLLTTDARLIPQGLAVQGLGLQVPDEDLQRMAFRPERTAQWTERYGIDFAALHGPDLGGDLRRKLGSQLTKSWRRSTPPITFAEVVLADAGPSLPPSTIQFEAIADGRIDAVLVYFTAHLGNGVELSLHPDDAGSDNSWRNLLHLLPEPFSVRRGAPLEARYSFDGYHSTIELGPVD
jgi:hypothetical protein